MNSINRRDILIELHELQADFEDFSDEELLDCREAMSKRVDSILQLLNESEEENIRLRLV